MDNGSSGNADNAFATIPLDMLRQIQQQNHAVNALRYAASLELGLQLLIEAHMPNLSRRFQAKLFQGYGPLGSFSAKIDLSFALGFIEEADYRTLHAVRDIRNHYAHTKDGATFDDAELKAKMDKLPLYPHALTHEIPRFVMAAIEQQDKLKKRLAAVVKMTREDEHGNAPSSSPEK